jgi:ABC-type spermidine/putrescine transport system permease subunit I
MLSGTAKGLRLILAASLLFVTAAWLVPLTFLGVHSLSHWNPAKAAFTAWPNSEAYRIAFRPDRLIKLWSVFRRSFILATVESIIALPFSWVLVRRISTAGRRAALACITVPFFCSPFVRGFGWRLLLQRNGPLSELLAMLHAGPPGGLSLVFNEYAVQLALFSGTFAFAVFPLFIAMSQIPENIWYASESCGAHGPQELLHIALPLSRNALGFAWSSVFLTIVGSSAEVWLVGGSSQHSLTTSIAELFDANQLPAAFALGLIAFAISALSSVAAVVIVQSAFRGPVEISRNAPEAVL